jgi:hypothetical protein
MNRVAVAALLFVAAPAGAGEVESLKAPRGGADDQ